MNLRGGILNAVWENEVPPTVVGVTVEDCRDKESIRKEDSHLELTNHCTLDKRRQEVSYY